MKYKPKFKQLSVGTILTDGKYILLGHATGTKNWDIPKGRQEEGESNIETAERELLEETGLAFNRKRFDVVGQHELNKHKDLFLYRIDFKDLKEEIDLSKLKCKSFFNKDNGDKVLEFDRFMFCKIKDIEDYCPKNLRRVLKEVL
jgi:8-oxo-dGTP pyrophosphatase MutT (NUDIX family)